MRTFLLLLIVSAAVCADASTAERIVTTRYVRYAFPIVSNQATATIIVDDRDHKGVLRAAHSLREDIERVTSANVQLNGHDRAFAIIIGTIGRAPLIDRLVEQGKINVAGIAGKWESTLIEVVNHPTPGITQALVIAGSDKRGTIFGIYELAAQIGVSPWHYWADVPVRRSETLYVRKSRMAIQSPVVKYRGIFLNDEAPALSGWATKTFGGFNHRFYEKVFELILRLKGNFLWPAMWGSAFNDDDPLNPVLAEEYGIVIGTSHHEPLTRAHDEWRRYGNGPWDYQKNDAALRNFWETGLERVKDKEIVVTLGMRGDGDEPMTEGTAIALLEQIVRDQRQIIGNLTQKPVERTPQVWALYKEVQDYYDKGMRVPDDVTLLLCDDNWGNLRRLPQPGEQPREGGYGIYYHFDYVGGPRNYKWINTNPIKKIWEQMTLAHEYGADRLWIVNVGDLKPMEFPISFFLDLAWNPDAPEIAYLIDQYGKYAGRIKPELLNANTYSLVNYNEWGRMVRDYDDLLSRAEYLRTVLDEAHQDAFYQLVFHPIQAMCNVYALYEAHAKNKLYAQQGRNTANFYADEVARIFDRDAGITRYYNDTLAGGKWKHMMDQTHIGYTYWQQPEKNVMPDAQRIPVPQTGRLGVAIEGSGKAWAGANRVDDRFPRFNSLSRGNHYVELFNTGKEPITYHIDAPPFVLLPQRQGTITDPIRLPIGIDWERLTDSIIVATVEISGNGNSRIALPIEIDNRFRREEAANTFVERNGYIAMEALNYSSAAKRAPISWKTLDNYGKTAGGITALPRATGDQILDEHTPHLTFDVFVADAGEFNLHAFVSPTLDFRDSGGLRFALSVNGGTPVTVNLENTTVDDRSWGRSVSEGTRITKTPLGFKRGKNTINYWLVSPGVVLQKLVLDLGGLKPSFLGPEDTFVGSRNN
ncbi:glycosyl hydrolase 115 family protein [Parapedobacter tibetensis]|uniref:glycosyl hydrolase 115 family protein n=1 Tax=Parapedobacter tibetensis TaxID=2972951 RepID=UPI00214D3889|nr:glycosyl hydrolase 115 family protein [Parapedobacter tibetensis]